jgi:steroid delta-isomerase-like uncharacterized protein
MSSAEPQAAVVRRFFDLYAGQHDVEGADALFAEDLIVNITAAPGSGPMDRAAFKQLAQAYLDGFPDLSAEIVEQYEADGRVITRVSWSGTQTGPLMHIPATGRAFRAESILIDRVEGGLIHERRQIDDMLGMLTQLGVVPM